MSVFALLIPIAALIALDARSTIAYPDEAGNLGIAGVCSVVYDVHESGETQNICVRCRLLPGTTEHLLAQGLSVVEARRAEARAIAAFERESAREIESWNYAPRRGFPIREIVTSDNGQLALTGDQPQPVEPRSGVQAIIDFQPEGLAAGDGRDGLSVDYPVQNPCSGYSPNDEPIQ
ncbi:hypothetical protein [Marinicauda salina]|uniref:hypothetical protein n=1 Tax=Marinicauda salina TaxID=2135793 RepID=UPI0011B1ED83|nr:hypothetical protein [Marinicauda salina]